MKKSIEVTTKLVKPKLSQWNFVNKQLTDSYNIDSPTDDLEEIALARLSRPEASLKELGASLNPPVGKSGVNHRLRKLKAIADMDREKKGGVL